MTFGAATTDVAARLSRETISSTTSPSTTEVQGFITEGAALVRQSLRAGGVAADPATDSDGQRVCRALVVTYAVARTLDVLALGEDAAAGSERAAVMLTEFANTLAEWREMGASRLASYLSLTGDASPATTTLRSHVATGGVAVAPARYQVGDLDRSF